MKESLSIEHIRAIKRKHEAELMKKPHVVAVGIGIPTRDGKPVGEPGIIVSVTDEADASQLRAQELIPQTLEDVPVWVEAIERPRAAGSHSAEATAFAEAAASAEAAVSPDANDDAQRGDEDGLSPTGQRPQDLSECSG